MTIFGYFDSARQTKPAFDPGSNILCPVCVTPLADPMKTISLMPVGGERSYFFRAHSTCWENADSTIRQQIEGSVIDAPAAKNDTT